MNKLYATVTALLLAGQVQAQVTTAMDFNRNDCSGNAHHLFASLDSGKVAILEFYMGPTCNSCIFAANELIPMWNTLKGQYPGKLDYYAIGYTNSYTCGDVSTWVTAHAPGAYGMDSGATQVAYYGGFSMPTIVAVGGPQHKVIWSANGSNGGYSLGDTAVLAPAIRNFFKSLSVQNVLADGGIKIFPNPAGSELSVQLNMTEAGEVDVQLLDMTGRVVRTKTQYAPQGKMTTQLDVHTLAAGSYTLKLATNGRLYTEYVTIAR